MTHGHEVKGGNGGGRGCAGWRGVKGGKWDNCNSVINKIYIYKILFYQIKKVNFVISSLYLDKTLVYFLKVKLLVQSKIVKGIFNL